MFNLLKNFFTKELVQENKSLHKEVIDLKTDNLVKTIALETGLSHCQMYNPKQAMRMVGMRKSWFYETTLRLGMRKKYQQKKLYSLNEIKLIQKEIIRRVI